MDHNAGGPKTTFFAGGPSTFGGGGNNMQTDNQNQVRLIYFNLIYL
ncbi:MAG: hypothetical protein MJ252_12615 [archaeon]|nr:hypothetical protein [archaeon]